MPKNNETANVSTGAPKLGGYAFMAPEGTALPEDAVTALTEAFKSLGFISEDGVVNANSPESENIKDWGGTTVYSAQSGKEDTFKFTLIESKNKEVLGLVYGDENVTGDLESGMKIRANNADLDYHAFVFEMMMSKKTKKRLVIPSGKVTEVGDITYENAEVIGYEVTITCRPDENGDTHLEYLKSKTQD